MEAMGIKPNPPPKYNYEASAIVNAYNRIARARSYEQCSPLPLHTEQIKSYLELNDAPCELHIFIDCIFAIDDIFIDEARKRQKREMQKNQVKK